MEGAVVYLEIMVDFRGHMASARFSYAPNGNGHFRRLSYTEPDNGYEMPKTMSFYCKDVSKEELVEIENAGDNAWIEYWSVNIGNLTQWAKANVTERGGVPSTNPFPDFDEDRL